MHRLLTVSLRWLLWVTATVLAPSCGSPSSGRQPDAVWHLAEGQGRAPWGIAVGSDGTVFVSNLFVNEIEVLDTNGAPIDRFPASGIPGSGTRLKYLDVDDDTGHVFVGGGEVGLWRIAEHTVDGALVRAFGEHGDGEGQFNGPAGVAVDAERDVVYVVDTNNNRIVAFSREGTFLRAWGRRGSGPGEFEFIDPEGWGADQGPEGGVDVDPDGNVYVVDNRNRRIQTFTPDGAFRSMWGRRGFAPGELQYPSGIAVSSDGRVFVVDNSTPRNDEGNVARLLVFDVVGTFLEEWTLSAGTDDRCGGNSTGIDVALDAAERRILVTSNACVVVYEI